MDILVRNRNLEAVAIIDMYESFIWTDRFYAYGDFELHTVVNPALLDVLRQDYYVQIKSSEHTMIIDEILIETNADDGNKLRVCGKSLESILNRRIIWGQITWKGNLQNAVRNLISTQIINPTNSKRKIDNFIFEWNDDPRITELTVEAQYTGDNVYDVVSLVCKENNIGFKITLNDNNQFVFKLYAGEDRSYDQTENPYVVFSPKFDNLIESSYLESKAALKNAALVMGEDTTDEYYETDNGSGTSVYISNDGTARSYIECGDSSGMDRRELFVDARDIQSETDTSGASYNTLLQNRGNEKLEENVDIQSFEGSIDPNGIYKINEDYFVGDIVQIANEYGHESRVRILEMVTSDESSGITVTPTFETIKEEVSA